MSSDPAISPDILILGGGVQGLFLLNDLRSAGYDALLLEQRELGGEQTCHSHVYIHQGYMYNEGETGLVARLKDVRQMWTKWLEERPSRRIESSAALFGYQNPADADEKAALWDSWGLGHQSLAEVPSALEGGVIRKVFEGPEFCLNGTWLVDELSRPVADYISRVESISTIRVDESGGRIAEVRAILPGSKQVVFKPNVLVVSAGRGNQELLDLATGGRRSLQQRFTNRQQIRKAHMLVVTGDPGTFGDLSRSGVFPKLRGLFIVPRRTESAHVWLVSDNRSPSVSLSEEWLARDAREWLPEVILALRELAPRSFHRLDQLQWGVYEAPKAEGRATGGVPHEDRIETYYGVENLWAIWPTKLTLAPRVSQEVVQQIQAYTARTRFTASIQPTWPALRCEAPVAPERWQLTPLHLWEDFCRFFHLSDLL